jgi:hypothetical protein
MLSFRGSDVGETAAPSHSASSSWPRGLSKGMRSPASPKRDADEPLKRLVREPWSIRKDLMALPLPCRLYPMQIVLYSAY